MSLLQNNEFNESALELSSTQLVALRLFEQFGQSVVSATEGIDPAPQELGSLMVSASGTVLAASLPACHHSPPGASIGVQWSSASPPALILRCSHKPTVGGPHCWAANGHATAC